MTGRVCGRANAKAPFTKLAAQVGEIVSPHHLPENFSFSNDPSHMWLEDVVTFLEFIQECQISDPNNVFRFHHWINDKGLIANPVEAQEGEDGPCKKKARQRQVVKRWGSQRMAVDSSSDGEVTRSSYIVKQP